MFLDKKIFNGIEDVHIRFFAQVFLELSSYKSAESYKSKMMMPLTLCIEYELIYLQKFEKGKSEALSLIVEELKMTIKQDKVSKKLLTFSLDIYEKKGLNNNEDKEQQYSIVKLIKEELAQYKYIDTAIELLDDKTTPHSDVLIMTSNLISLLNYLNFKNSYLFYAAKKYFEVQRSNYSVKDFFEEMIFSLGQNYDVYIEIKKMPNIIDSDFFKENLNFIQILSRNETTKLKEDRIFTTKLQKVLKFNNIEEVNPYQAISEAKKILRLMDITYNVFEHKDKIQIAKGNSLAIDTNNQKRYYFNNEVSVLTHQKNLQRKALKERFFHFSSNFIIGNESRNKFEKSLILHSYAVRNDNPENQLIFFWNAIETLTFKKNNSIIDSVLEFLLPFLKKRYFFENFKYVYSHIALYQKVLFQEFFDDEDLIFNLDNFIKVLVVKDNEIYHNIRTKIFSERLDEFPLLRNRLYNFHEFHKSKNILSRLDRHEQSLIQQIKRVYRYRNLIIHDSKNIEIMDTLLSNIHNYFDYVMDEIIEHSHKKKILNINELNLYLTMQLDKQKKDLTSQIQEITEENYLEAFLIDRDNSELKF